MSSPYARKLAREAGVDYTQAKATGPGGRIVAADIQQLISSGGGKGQPAEDSAPAAQDQPADAEVRPDVYDCALAADVQQLISSGGGKGQPAEASAPAAQEQPADAEVSPGIWRWRCIVAAAVQQLIPRGSAKGQARPVHMCRTGMRLLDGKIAIPLDQQVLESCSRAQCQCCVTWPYH